MTTLAIPQSHLDQIAKMAGRKCAARTAEIDDIDTWTDLGSPTVVELVETYKNYKVYRDSGYGNLILFEDDNIVDMSHHHIIHKDIVVMCPEYYSTTKHIHIAAP